MEKQAMTVTFIISALCSGRKHTSSAMRMAATIAEMRLETSPGMTMMIKAITGTGTCFITRMAAFSMAVNPK